MRFLIDAQLSPALCRWFATKGHEASHVRDFLTDDAPDQRVAEIALTDARVVVSKDSDFIPISTRTGVRVLLLRCGNLRPRPMTMWLEARWPRVEPRLLAHEW